jgi:voltage-gated potassium channel Kch
MNAVVTLSMVATPFLMQLIDYIRRRMPETPADLEGPEFSPETNVIVIGYGRFGQTVSQMLMAKRILVTIIDRDSEQIEVSQEFGTKVYYGDGTRLDLLRLAGAESAEGIFFCHDERMDRGRLEPILKAFPQARVMVRVFDRREMMHLNGLDVELLQRELFESAVLMGRKALVALGVAEREAARVEAEYRSRDSERLERQSETGDIRAAMDRMFGAGRPIGEPETERVTAPAPGNPPAP